MSQASPSRRLAVRAALAVAGVVAVLSVAAVAAGQVNRLPDWDGHFAPHWLALSLAGFLALQLLCVELWRLNMHWLGAGLPRPEAYAVWNVSVLGRYVPTSALMALARIGLAKRAGAPKRLTAASVLYEFALMIAGAATVAAYCLIRLDELRDSPVRFLLIAVPVGALVALHPRIFQPLANAALRRLGREGLPRAVPTAHVIVLWLLYVAAFALGGLATFFLVKAVRPTDAADLPLIAASFAVGFTASALAFVMPAGLGAREAAVAATLSPVLPLGVAVAVAVATRLIQLAIELVLAAGSAFVARERLDLRGGLRRYAEE